MIIASVANFVFFKLKKMFKLLKKVGEINLDCFDLGLVIVLVGNFEK